MARLKDLHDTLHRVAAGYSGKATYALFDLTSGERIGASEDNVMPTASLIKVPILVALYQAIENGEVGGLDDRIVLSDTHRCLGSGVLNHLASGVEMSVRDAAVLMIIISDNTATNMMIDHVGIDRINQTMRNLGLAQTTLFLRLGDRSAGLDPRKMSVSTAGEMARLMELIARHEAVSHEASEDMLRIMRRQDYRHELSSELPWNEMNRLDNHRQNWVAEKGGSFLNGVRTSAGVFHSERGTYTLAAFCEGGTGPGSGRNSEGNRLLGALGLAAWRELAAAD
ncbi:MAG: serine hydrolase [Chloroflexota bacterium]